MKKGGGGGGKGTATYNGKILKHKYLHATILKVGNIMIYSSVPS